MPTHRTPAIKRLSAAIALLVAVAVPFPLLAAPAPADFSSLLQSAGTGSPASEQNYRAFLPSLYRVANARPLEAAYRPIRKTISELAATLAGRGSERFVAQSSTASATRFTCPEGGSVTASATVPGYGGKPTVAAQFKGCGVDGQRLSGAMSWNANYSETALFGPTANGAARAPFTLTDATGLITRIDGSRSVPGTPGESYRQLGWHADWSLQSGAKKLTVEGMELAASNDGNGSLSYTTDFRMTGSLTNGKLVSVSTFAPFTSEVSPDFSNGYLQVLVLRDAVSADNLMAISAATDPGATFNVKIDTYAAGQGKVSTLEANIPQKLGGGLLKLTAR